MNLLARWRQLSEADRRALWPAAWCLLRVRMLLSMHGLKATQARLALRAPAGARMLDQAEIWQTRARALQRISRCLPATRCLARSLTLWWWMRTCDLNPQLHLGVSHIEGTLQGHAWVECDGHLFDETPDGAARWSRINAPFRP